MNQPEHKGGDLERRLALPEVLDLLMADGMVSVDDGGQLKHERRYFRGDTHPLIIVAEQKWKSAKPPHRLLTLDDLSEWLAGRSGLPYYHIDPLKVDFSGVTEVMSNAYATRFKILPVEVTPRDVVIATAEPFVREWEKELRPILRKDIRRVIANPQVIERYIVRQGEGILEIDGARQKLQIGDQAVIPAGAAQRIENTGSVDLEFYCLCTPRFFPQTYVNLEQ